MPDYWRRFGASSRLIPKIFAVGGSEWRFQPAGILKATPLLLSRVRGQAYKSRISSVSCPPLSYWIPPPFLATSFEAWALGAKVWGSGDKAGSFCLLGRTKVINTHRLPTTCLLFALNYLYI